MLSWRVKLALLSTVFTLATYQFLKPTLALSYGFFLLPLQWPKASSSSLITMARDKFDVTFDRYPVVLDKPGIRKTLLIPSIIHHINLGGQPLKAEWEQSRAACLGIHQSWETHLWEDENASRFVEETFPEMKSTWDSYRYPMQRANALRYMLLWKYGGAVLDLDLSCKRSLEPLRRFKFVAPAADLTGFSIEMIMSTPKNSFVGELINNLPTYNHRWLLNPYLTVMLSTGCQYASTIFMKQVDRTDIRILTGTEKAPRLHELKPQGETPLFKYLGSPLSWHLTIADLRVWSIVTTTSAVVIILLLIPILYVWRRVSRRRRLNLADLEPPPFPDTLSKEV